MICFCTDLHGFSEGGSTSGKEHEFLKGKLVSCVRATVDNIEGRAGENIRRLDTRELGEVLVERNTLLTSAGLSNSDGNTEDGVGTKFSLVGSAIKLDEEVINILLLGHSEAALNEGRGDDVVNVVDSLGNTLILMSDPVRQRKSSERAPLPT